MKLNIWIFILILDFVISIQGLAEANTPLFRKKKQQCNSAMRSKMPCTSGSDCCSTVCDLPQNSEEQDKSGKQCVCSFKGYPCFEKEDCCDESAVCRNNRCHIVINNCGIKCRKGSDCFGDCPFCKNGKCVKGTANCGEPCPSESNYECLEGVLCRNKICYCSTGCKLTNKKCNDKSECCKNACTRLGLPGGRKVCA